MNVSEVKCKDGMMLKRADTHTRPMTQKELFEMAISGKFIFRYRSLVGNYTYTTYFSCGDKENIMVAYADAYCLPCDMTDDEPSTWEWRELKTDRKLNKVG